MGIPMIIIAIILLYLFSPVCFAFAIISGYALTSKHRYFRNIAISLDQMGNVIGAPLFNVILIKGYYKYLFGNPDELISSVLGKNKQRNTLTFLGLLLSKLLNLLDENHIEKSIE